MRVEVVALCVDEEGDLVGYRYHHACLILRLGLGLILVALDQSAVACEGSLHHVGWVGFVVGFDLVCDVFHQCDGDGAADLVFAGVLGEAQTHQFDAHVVRVGAAFHAFEEAGHGFVVEAVGWFCC